MTGLAAIRDAARVVGVQARRKSNVADVLLVPCPECGGQAEVMAAEGGGFSRFCECDQRWHRTSPEELKRDWARRGIARVTQDPDEEAAIPRHARTDAGNAERFRGLYGGIVRYVHKLGRWRVWTGKQWRDDAKDGVEQLALLTARHRLELAASLPDDRERYEEAKWALASESMKRRRDMLGAARSLPELACLPDDFDRDPFLLNCDNGTLDLRTGELRPHDAAAMQSKLIPVAYDPKAECPRWERFLEEVFDGTTAIADFVQRAVGYSLTGDTREQCLFLLHGSGCNGKSVFLRTVLRLLGDYGATTDFATLTLDRERQAAIRNDIARLHGARFVTASETSDGVRFSESVLKSLTGEDRVAVRFLHQEFFEFTPAFKLWVACNHRPRVRDSSEAFWRRIRLIPFTVSFRGREDKELADALQSELPGVLAWAVRGCRDWLEVGDLIAPAEVLTATEKYRSEEDVIGRFIADCCLTDEGMSAAARDLYESYCRWCGENGERPFSQKRFGDALREKGFEGQSGTVGETRGRRIWAGLGLVEEQL